jgi:hypothetical protein
VSAVLSLRYGRYQVPTLLPRHEAFWNMASTGLEPPTWLDGDPVAGRSLAA